MLNGILFGLKKFFSEIGSGDMVILFSSLILSVTAISGVGFLSDRFQRSIQQQASIVLGAEMVFRSGAPIEDRYIQTAELKEIKTAETTSFLTMALTDEDNILASIKAVSSAYPLVGNLQVIPQGRSNINLDLKQPAASTVWVEEKILEALNTKPGELITLGNKSFKITGTLIDFPDRSTGFLSFSPTIIVNDADLDEMGVIQAGSRVVYRQLYSGESSELESFLEEVEGDLNEVRVQKVSDIEGQLGNSVNESSQFANLAALFTILITLVSSMIAARRYAKRHLIEYNAHESIRRLKEIHIVVTNQSTSDADFNGNTYRLYVGIFSASTSGKYFEPNHKQRTATTNCKTTLIGFFDSLLHRDCSMWALFKGFGIG